MNDLMIKKILVSIDYSETSTNALSLAIALSRLHKAEIKLIYAADFFECISVSRNGLMINFSKEAFISSETQRLWRLANDVMDSQTDRYSVECRIGSMSSTIVEAARDFESDLIVTGTQSTTGIKAYFMGSEACHIAKTASCPVLTVPNHYKWTGFKEILFPVRPVVNALAKYERAMKIIHDKDTHLTVLGLFNEDEPQHTEELVHLLSNLENRLLQDGIKSKAVFTTTDSGAETVLNKSRQLAMDLIVITADSEKTTGPYVQQIVDHAKVPVLSFSPQVCAIKQVEPDCINT